MKRRFILPIICIAVISLSATAAEPVAADAQTPASGSDWPQWAGPDGNYTSPEKGLLHEWPAEGPEVLWRAKIGSGWSCPSVSGNEVYVVSTEWSTKWEDGEKEVTACLDTKTGKELWRYVFDTRKHYQSANVNIGWYWGGPRATPMVTEKYVYSLGVIGHLACLDRKSHQLVWEADLNSTYWPGPYPEWKGVFFSPIVAEGVVLVPLAYDGNRCVALDAETGKQKWIYPADTQILDPKKSLPGDRTPVIATFGTDRCAIIYSFFPCQVRALRLSDGKLVWEFSDTSHNNGVQKVSLSGNQLIISTGLNALSFDTDFKNAPFAAKVASVAEYRANYHGVVACGDAFYGLSINGDAGNLPKWEGPLVCIDRATGKQLWAQTGFKSGSSMIGADGLLFARSFQSLYLVEASSKGYVEKGKIEKLHDVTNAQGKDGGWVMPVLSRGQLYIRTPNELICYKVK